MRFTPCCVVERGGVGPVDALVPLSVETTDVPPNVTIDGTRSLSFECCLESDGRMLDTFFASGDSCGPRAPGLRTAAGEFSPDSGLPVWDVDWLRRERTLLLNRPARFVQDVLGE